MKVFYFFFGIKFWFFHIATAKALCVPFFVCCWLRIFLFMWVCVASFIMIANENIKKINQISIFDRYKRCFNIETVINFFSTSPSSPPHQCLQSSRFIPLSTIFYIPLLLLLLFRWALEMVEEIHKITIWWKFVWHHWMGMKCVSKMVSMKISVRMRGEHCTSMKLNSSGEKSENL